MPGTRRDPVAPPGTRRDGVDPPGTRRDGTAPPGTGRDARPGGGYVGDLPPELRAEYTVVDRPAGQGNEADVYVVTDARGTERILKIYKRDIAVDRTVYRVLAGLGTTRVVAVEDCGTLTDGRDYEVLEYLRGGDLRARLRSGALDTGQVRELVEQMAEALGKLKERRVVHRDVKPENILLRSTTGLDLALTDFGLSRRLDQSVQMSSAARTLHYAAPETFAGGVSFARDWWSLGMIVREAATGKRPFDPSLSEQVVMHHLMTERIDLSEVTDPRLNLLCRGLLVRSPGERWGVGQVTRWLAGESPEVPDEGVVGADGTVVPPFTLLDDEVVADPLEAAGVLERNRVDGRRELFAVPDSSRWRAFTDWLGRFDGDKRYFEGRARQLLCDELAAPDLPPDVKLVRLLTFLAPDRPASYLDRSVAPAALPPLASAAARGDDESRRVVEDLWRHDLLRHLAVVPDGRGLDAIQADWHERVRRYRQARNEVPVGVQQRIRNDGDEDDAATSARYRCLVAAAGGGADDAGALATAAASWPYRIDWFDELLRWAGSDPARLLVAGEHAGAAARQSEDLRLAEERRAQEAVARRERWDEREQQRLAGRGSAVARAVGGAAVLLIPWLLFLLIAGSASVSITEIVLVAWLGQLAAEIVVAYRLGRSYHPEYSLLRFLGVLSGEIGGRFRYRGGAALIAVIVTVVVMRLVLQAVAPVVPILVLLAHLGWAGYRMTAWQRAHVEEEREALEVGREW